MRFVRQECPCLRPWQKPGPVRKRTPPSYPPTALSGVLLASDTVGSADMT